MEQIYECTKTKSVLNILGPIAKQVINLKESEKDECDATVVLQLLKLCKALHSSCNHLLKELHGYAERSYDVVLSKVVKESTLELTEIIKRLTDSTNDLHQGEIIVKSVQETWNQLITDIEKLFEGLVKILLAWDHSYLDKINNALDELQFSLSALKERRPLEKLSLSYQAVVSNAVSVFNLVSERCEDVSSKQQKNMLHMLCLQLHSLFPLLSSVIANCTVHPQSKLLKANKNCVLAKLSTIISEIKIEIGMGSSSYELQIPASFINTIDGLFESIKSLQAANNSNHSNTSASYVKVLKGPIEVILKYAIGLATSCTKPNYSAIMSASENVLHQIKVLSDLEGSENPDKVDIDVTLDVLADVLEVLELKVNTSLIRLIVQALADPFSSLEEVLTLLKNSDREETLVDEVNIFIKIFENDLDKICQIGNFTIACTSDEERARKIESSLATLEWLESILIPSMMSASKDFDSDLCVNISVLGKQWVAELVNLRNLIDLSMDPAAFSLVTKQEVHEIWGQLREQLSSCEHDWLKQQVHKVYCLVRRILTLDRASLFLYDSFRVEINTVLKELKKYEEIIFINEPTEEQKRSLLKRVQLLLTILSHLAESLNQDYLLRSECEELVYGEDLQDKLPPHKLCDSKRKILQSSLIEDIPVDVDTPAYVIKDDIRGVEEKELEKMNKKMMMTPTTPTTSDEKHLTLTRRTPKRTNGSMELLNVITEKGIKRQLFEDSSVNAINDKSKKQPCDLSIDITKFLLSRSTNTFRNSARGSKRNFSLRVKEMDMDINDILNLKPIPEPCKESVDNLVLAKPVSIGLHEKSTEISVDNLADILKNLETLTENLTQTTEAQMTDARMQTGISGVGSEEYSSEFNSYEVPLPVKISQESTASETDIEIGSFSKVNNSNVSDIKYTSVDKVKSCKSTEIENPDNSEPCVGLLATNSVNDSSSQSTGNFSETKDVSSIIITTPQRLGDLKVVHRRLAALKAMFR